MIAPELRTSSHAGETLRVVREVALTGTHGPRSMQLVEVVRSVCVGATPSTPPQSDGGRRALVDLLVLAACIETEVDAEKEKLVLERARQWRIDSPWLRALPALRQRRILTLKRALASRAPDARRVLARSWSEDGVAGALGAAAFVLGIYRDAALAKRFRYLGELAQGTLGRAFHDHLVSRGMRFPGEHGGMPERMVHHDLMHVLNDYGTDAAGECQLGAFYAGHCSSRGEAEWFTFFIIVVATFHLELAVSPAVVTPTRGAFDPRAALLAFDRGSRVTTDVMGRWDYWSLMPLPLAEARSRLGLAPPNT